MENITVLFPGAFKPMHAGHIDLISKYTADPSVNEVKILIGPGKRGEIDQNLALKIAQNLIPIEMDSKIRIQAVSELTPVTTAYKFVANADPGTYTLAASSKETENINRTKLFVLNHNNGKYPLPKGVKVIEMTVDIDPLIYEGRTDQHNGKPISASVLRHDLEHHSFENFKTNYPNCSEDTIITIWNLLHIK